MSFAASEALRLMAVVVLPTPPFWFAIAMTLANLSLVFHVERPSPRLFSPNLTTFFPVFQRGTYSPP
jgi:hypothetical protein